MTINLPSTTSRRVRNGPRGLFACAAAVMLALLGVRAADARDLAGMARLPARAPIPQHKTQLLSVVSDSWPSTHAQLQRYERVPGAGWRSAGATIPVVLGRSGYGWGDGLHGAGPPEGRSGPLKREGDGRSPAGVFEIGTAYGYAADAGLRIAYQRASAGHVCVDDPESARYNQIFVAGAAERDFRSAERMHRDDGLYELAIVIEHNVAPVAPGHGSCIFLHVWAGPDTPVSGCTAMALPALQALARWLKPDAALLVALPRKEYAGLQRAWELP